MVAGVPTLPPLARWVAVVVVFEVAPAVTPETDQATLLIVSSPSTLDQSKR